MGRMAGSGSGGGGGSAGGVSQHRKSDQSTGGRGGGDAGGGGGGIGGTGDQPRWDASGTATTATSSIPISACIPLSRTGSRDRYVSCAALSTTLRTVADASAGSTNTASGSKPPRS